MDVISGRNQVVSQVVVALLLLGGCLGYWLSQQPEAQAANTTYYVDCSATSNGSGTSQSSPWNNLATVNGRTFGAGDRILFKADSTCIGQLWAKGSGASGSPIIISSYGNGNRPIIAGSGIVSDTVLLSNQQYWEIRNLEVTNKATSAGIRRGIRVTASDAGTLNYIRIIDNLVHDITGDRASKATGGIVLEAAGSSTPTKWNDVKIENNTVYNASRVGIYSTSSWSGFTNGAVPNAWTNLVFRNNTLYNIEGDAMIIRAADAPLIEYNVAYNTSTNCSGYCVAIWGFNIEDAVYQYNEAYLTKTTNDGQAFDIDYNQTRITYQYNYSHDNDGGFILLASKGGTNGVIRYNISENDKRRIFQFTVGNTNGLEIYNNTVYIGSGLTTALWARAGATPSNITSTNNIFYNLGSGGWDLGSGTGIVFNYNIFYGNHPATEPSDANKITADPKFVNPNTGGNGRNTLNGYKLQTGSPALGSGLLIPNNGGKDYWGNSVSATAAPNRGAYNGVGLGTTNADVTNLYAVGDGYTRDGTYANDNYAFETGLTIKDGTIAGFRRKAYLRFNTAGLTGVTGAKLRLYLNNTQNGAAVTIKVYGGTSDSWTESSLTWNTAPGRETTAQSTVNVQTVDYYDFDVTSFVQSLAVGDNVLTLVVEGSAGQDLGANFASREDTAKQPVLIVTN
jgi:hypothetical protein